MDMNKRGVAMKLSTVFFDLADQISQQKLALSTETVYLWHYACKDGHNFYVTNPKGGRTPLGGSTSATVYCPLDKNRARLVSMNRHRAKIHPDKPGEPDESIGE
jgi:hypothetical protein